MRRIATHWTLGIAALLVLALPALAAPEVHETMPIASEHLGGTILSLTPTIGFDHAVLRVTGPDGYALTKHFKAAGSITVDLLAEAEPRLGGDQNAADSGTAAREASFAALPDGQYNYEVVFSDADGGRLVLDGAFFASRGTLASPASVRPDPPGVGASDQLGALAATGSTQASIESPSGGGIEQFIFIDDTNNSNNTRVGLEQTNFVNFGLQALSGSLRMRTGTGPGFSENLLVALPGGNVGIGTATPSRPLHVVAGTPALQLEGTGGSFFRLRNNTAGVGFLNFDTNLGANRLVLTGDGRLGAGVGFGTPNAPLHVLGSPSTGPNTAILERTDGGTANLFFQTTAQTWAFQNATGTGVFAIRDHTAGVSPFVMEPGADANTLRIVSGGFVAVRRGNASFPIHALPCGARLSNAGTWVNCSSRSLKTAFQAIDPLEVLTKVASLPVQAWRYKAEEAGSRHIGPVAEDFQRLFGIGDGESLAAADTGGVALAAIQGLKRLLDSRDAEIAEVREANASLEARLAALEARLDSPSP